MAIESNASTMKWRAPNASNISSNWAARKDQDCIFKLSRMKMPRIIKDVDQITSEQGSRCHNAQAKKLKQ
jgi:hypothetical protein